MSSLFALTACLLTSPNPGSINDIVQHDSRFTLLGKLLQITGMDMSLSGDGGLGYTLFAPTDAAFRKLPPKVLQAILTRDRLGAPIVGGHLLQGKYGLMSFTNGVAPVGQPLRYHLKSIRDDYIDTEVTRSGTVVVNGVNIIDQKSAKNGMILAVDGVMPIIIDPPRNEGLSRALPAELYRWNLGRYRTPKQD